VERTPISNPSQVLDAEAAQALTRDPLVVDFIRGVPGRERDLELALLADIERFMTALGKGFSFYGRQLALVVGEREFIVDLRRREGHR
jgi:predicted nuclease of restriction endonuclease-like (RecB) superfamily